MGNINVSGGFTKKNDSVAFKYEIKDDGTLFIDKQEAHDYNASQRAAYRSLGDRRRVKNTASPLGYDFYEYTGLNASENADIAKLILVASGSGQKGDKGDKGDPGDASTVPGPKGDKGDKGDPGSVIQKIVFVDSLPDPLTADTLYAVAGFDDSFVLTAVGKDGQPQRLTAKNLEEELFDNSEGIVAFQKVGNKLRSQFNWDFTISNPSARPGTPSDIVVRAELTALRTELIQLISAPVTKISDISGILAWFKTDEGVQQLDGIVNSVLDKGKLGNDLITASSAARPLYYANGGANNKPFISFNGDKALRIPAMETHNATDLTIFIVSKQHAVVNQAIVMELTDVIDQFDTGFALTVNNNGNTHNLYVQGDVGINKSSISPDSASAEGILDKWQILEMHCFKGLQGNEAKLIIGNIIGQNEFSNDNTNGFSPGFPFSLGGRSVAYTDFANFDFAELLVFERQLAPVETNIVRTELKTKYSL